MGLRCVGAEVVIEVAASVEWPAWLAPVPEEPAPGSAADPAAEVVTV